MRVVVFRFLVFGWCYSTVSVAFWVVCGCGLRVRFAVGLVCFRRWGLVLWHLVCGWFGWVFCLGFVVGVLSVVGFLLYCAWFGFGVVCFAWVFGVMWVCVVRFLLLSGFACFGGWWLVLALGVCRFVSVFWFGFA